MPELSYQAICNSPLIPKIADHYGSSHQQLKLIEEMAELTRAIIQNDTIAIIEEMADVQILLDQLHYLYFSQNKTNNLRTTYIATFSYKLERQLARIQEEKRNDK